MRRFLAAAGLTAAFAGSALADPALTNQPTAMRESPSFRAPVVQSIPAHAEIDIEHCGRGWCAASWRDISGFVAVNAISSDDAPPPVYRDGPPPGPYLGPPLAPPLFGWGWGYGWRPHYY